ncbi:hypothetical protein NCHU2750_28260 [Neorhizobium sp. NCHU2750]|nr:hypothetical protein NCHU2750_28260 [Neorhizobium sp. NCHU2750]
MIEKINELLPLGYFLLTALQIYLNHQKQKAAR